MTNLYSQEQQEKIKQEIGTLEDSIQEIYKTRKPRTLFGSEGIIIRTLGPRFGKHKHKYVPTYFDSRREERVQTEYAEFIESCDIYDEDSNEYTLIDMLMEAGDILFQKEIIERFHQESQGYKKASDLFKEAISRVEEKLQRRKQEIANAKKMCDVKYGVRAWLARNNHSSKNHELEEIICLSVYQNEQ